MRLYSDVFQDSITKTIEECRVTCGVEEEYGTVFHGRRDPQQSLPHPTCWASGSNANENFYTEVSVGDKAVLLSVSRKIIWEILKAKKVVFTLEWGVPGWDGENKDKNFV